MKKGVWEKRYERCLICSYCNSRICRRKQSRTPQNPNRWFYTCPHDKKFNKWEDEVKPHEWILVPYCGGCGAGLCRVKRVISGSSPAGRIMFLCRIKEGEGSCGYRVWQDELAAMEAREVEEKKKREAEAVEAMINNQNQLNVLREHISSTKDRLFQIEAEVSCCEVEMRLLKLQLEKLSKNKEVLEGKHLMTSKELEQSQKLLEEKEAEQSAAFDRARASLLG
ncbi:uncharacterized protein LOC125213503 [Salvia hispanica]|uniref:uncharacterized protein LOC125213503 n=1 Tax=Salvia hispanica TaxID=49212 RepID=UPI0020092FA9|nr:uncharacterized protein LOC125213503 [Salvia hispanica]